MHRTTSGFVINVKWTKADKGDSNNNNSDKKFRTIYKNPHAPKSKLTQPSNNRNFYSPSFKIYFFALILLIVV